MTDVLIRDLDAATNARLIEKARLLSLRKGSTVSRNMLCKIIIEKAMVNDSMLDQFKEIDELRQEFIELKEALKEYVETNNIIVQALLTGMVGDYE